MKKKLSILLCAVILIAAVCIWQRNNIEALYLFITNDRDGVNEIIRTNQKELEEKIKEYSDYVPRNLTPEEEAKIASGEMTVEEATELLISEVDAKEASAEINAEATKKDETVPTETKPTETKPTETKPAGTVSAEAGKNGTKEDAKKKESEIIKRYTANFYSMKAYYIGQLNQIEANARSEYAAMSNEQKKNLSKASFVAKYAGYATGLQSECDAKVEALLSEMKKEIKNVGGDISIIDTIRQAYAGEKAARKAYYMNMVS